MKPKKLSAVLFDLDGTLLDTAPDFHSALNHLRSQEGLPEVDYRVTQQTVSNGAAALIKAAFPHPEDSPDFRRLHQQLLEYYLANIAVGTRLYPGMAALLGWLDQERIPWGIVTNKPHRFTTPLLQQLELAPRCAAVVCPDHVTHRKPHPEALLLACQQLNCEPEQVIYVGDHLRDIEAGRNAGMETVAALYGYLEEGACPEQWNAGYQAVDAAAIQAWLQQRFNSL